MSFKNDAFSLNFNDLYSKYPNRRVTIYRYKVKNYNTTMRGIIVHPKRNVLFLLEDETIVKSVLNTFQSDKTTISIASGQEPGVSEGVNNETITVLTSDLLPVDYREELYIYTLAPIQKKQLESTDLYLDTLGASTFPDYQELFFKGSKDSDKKVSNVLTLGKLKLKTPASNYQPYSYLDEDLDYFDGNENIKLQLPGPLGEFGTSYIDSNNHIRQAEYELQEDDSHKYATIQLQPTRLSPELVLSSDTYDQNKNLSFELARRFIGKQTSLRVVWDSLGFKLTGNTADAKLYWAFLTIIFLSNQRVTEFKNYRISDTNSPNLGKITAGISSNLYGVAVDDILSIEQIEFSGRILKVWEQEFADELKDESSKLNVLYQSVKGILAGLTEYVPSPYSFGNYEKIGRLALEWYFVPESMQISLTDVSSRVDFKVQLQSLKYEFDEKTKLITGLKEKYRKISSVRSFNLGGQVYLPSIPSKFIEENKISTAGAVDTSNISFLNYTWIFQLKSQSKYSNLFQTDNPFVISGKTPNEYFVPFSSSQIFARPEGTFDEKTLPGLESYIKDNLITTNRTISPGSAKVIIKRKITSGPTGEYQQTTGGSVPKYGVIFLYQYKFTWEEEQIQSITAKPIKPPYSIDQSQWESFESALGSNVSEYILKPIYNEKIGTIRKLSDIYWKCTLSNYATIELTAIKKDGSKEIVSLEFEQGFKRDQTLVQEGVYV